MMHRLVLVWISIYASTFAAEKVPWLKKETTSHLKIVSTRVWNQNPAGPQCDVFVVATSPSTSPTRSLQNNQRIQNEVSHDPLLSRSSARWMLVLCAFMYGTTYPLTKSLQESIHPSMVTALRFNIAALFFLPHLTYVWNHPTLMWCSMELGLWCSIGFISQAMVLSETSASKAAFFGGLSVVMPPLFELIMTVWEKIKKWWIEHSSIISLTNTSQQPRHQPLTDKAKLQTSSTTTTSTSSSTASTLLASIVKSPLITPALALCGAAWLACGGFVCADLRWSDLRLLITPASFAMCFWRASAVSNRFPDAPLMSITATLLTTTALVCSAWSIVGLMFACHGGSTSNGGVLPFGLHHLPPLLSCFFHEINKVVKAANPLDSKDGLYVLLGLLYSAICATAITSIAEQQALRVVTASELTLIYALEPLFATLLAWTLMGEEISFSTLIGAGFVVLACLWDILVSSIVCLI